MIKVRVLRWRDYLGFLGEPNVTTDTSKREVRSELEEEDGGAPGLLSLLNV